MRFSWKNDKGKNKPLESPQAEGVLSYLAEQFTVAVNDLNATVEDNIRVDLSALQRTKE